MQQAFQKNTMGLQTGQNKQASQSNLNLSQNYQINNRQGQKSDVYNFATVTANTGNMIIANQPTPAKIDPVVPNTTNLVPKAQTQNRISNKSKCLSDSKHAYANMQGQQGNNNNHFASKSFNQSNQKYNQSNHHTLQCISDINDFKQKINQVLQTQAFPQGIQQAINNHQQNTGEIIPTKAIVNNVNVNAAANGTSLNPSSRLGYSQQLKQQSPTPNFCKSNMFQKRTIKTQNQAIYDAELANDFDNQVSTAFQSFKHNIKTNAFMQQNDDQSQSVKLTQGTYLLRGQKDKNRNQYQQFKNAQSNSVQSAGEFSGNGGTREVINNKLNQINHEIKQLQTTSKKGYVTNMLGHQQQYLNSGGYSAHQNSQRRKLLIDHNSNPQMSEAPNSRMKHQSPMDINSQRGSRQNRNSVFGQYDPNNIQRFDFLDSLANLNVELMDEKDKEGLKEVCIRYCTDLRYLIQQQLGSEQDQDLSTNPTMDQLTETDKGKLSSMKDLKSDSQKEQNGEDGLGAEIQHQESSEQKFKENEKNLKEDRLIKESKIEIPMAPEKRPILKSGTPHKVNPSELDNNAQNIEEIQNIPHEDVSINLHNSSSQSNFQLVKKVNEDGSENKLESKPPVSGLLEHRDKYTELQKKLNTLYLFMGNLENEQQAQMMGNRIQQQTGKAVNDDYNPNVNFFGATKPSQSNEWMHNMLQIKMFLNSLNCQKPTPQQINVMNNSKQRLDLFKVLQAREHVKFTNIQSEKMLNFHVKLENELEQRLKVTSNESQKFVNYLLQNGIQSQNKAQNAEIMSQLQQKQIQSMYNLQQLKNMRKQQQNDQKAFSIFQMNELAQFRSMSDGQQKQILLNNLQQGKFDDFDNLVEPLTFGNIFKSFENQQPSKMTKSEVIMTIEQAVDLLRKRSSLQTGQRNEDDLIRINSQEISVKNGELTPQKNNGQVQNRKSMLTPKIDDAINDTSSHGPNSIKLRKGTNQVQSQQQSDRFPLMKQQANNEDFTSSQNNQQLTQLSQNFEISKQKFEQTLKQNMLKQKRIKIFCQQMNEAFGSYFTNSRIYQQYSQSGMGMELLPSVQKGMLNGSELDDKQRARLKARQSMGISNLPRPIDRTKSKPNVLAGNLINNQNNTLQLQQKIQEKKEEVKTAPLIKKEDDKKEELKTEDQKNDSTVALNADGSPEETPIAEVKKPRYFPPKKLPNPFENAAQEQEKFLQARKEALAKYSMLSKNRFKQDENAPLKYVIRTGNNSKIIHKVMEKSGRLEVKYDNEGGVSFPGWEAADDYYDSLYNFKWKPTSSGIKYDLISKHGLKQLVNHVKGHYSLTTKDNLFINMKSYYESQKQNIYDVLPMTIVLDYLKDDVGDKVETFNNILKIVDKNLDQSVELINAKMNEMQIQREKSVKSMYKFSNSMHGKQNLWLLKPTGFNRGIGIHIFSTFDQLKDIMSNFYGIGRGAKDRTSIYQTHNQNHLPREMVDQNGEKQHRNFSFVVQKLIEKPLLYLQRKFDIRVWVLLDTASGKVYVFNEAYVRTSSKEYVDQNNDIDYEEKIAMQLTNNAVQRENPEYGKYEEGNIVSVDTLFNYVSNQDLNYDKKSKTELKNDFNESVKKFVIESMKSVKGKIVQQKYTFELFGYDFILDEDLNNWLIEINTNPCLEESNKLLKCIIPRMIDDLFGIVMDPLFYPSDSKYKSAFPLNAEIFKDLGKSDKPIPDKEPHKGYRDNENLFKFVCNLEQ